MLDQEDVGSGGRVLDPIINSLCTTLLHNSSALDGCEKILYMGIGY